MTLNFKSVVYKFFLALTSIEGIAALFFLARIPSEEKNARLWGFSSSRLFIAGFVIILLLALLAVTLRAWLKPG